MEYGYPKLSPEELDVAQRAWNATVRAMLDNIPPPDDFECRFGTAIRLVKPDGTVERIDPKDFYAKPDEEPAPTSTPATTS